MKQGKLVCFDLDGTLSGEQSWLHLNTALGMSASKDQELYEAYHRGDFSYEEWMQQIIDSYTQGERSHKDLIEDLYTNLELSPHAVDVVAKVHALGYDTFLLSGSFDMYVVQAAKKLSITNWHACTTIVFDAYNYVERFDHSGDESQAKQHVLESFAQSHGYDLDECICVGDGPNDLDIFKITGKGVTFTGTSITDSAWKVIDSIEELPSIL